MSWRNIKLIFFREVFDQLRDRRTLFMIAVLPLLLYPALGIGMVQMTLLFSEQPRTVVILGADNLPEPPLVEEGRFVSDWFDRPENAEKLSVVTDRASEADLADISPERREALLEQARRIRGLLVERQRLEAELDRATAGRNLAAIARLERELHTAKGRLGSLFSGSAIQVLIVVPDGLDRSIEQLSRELAQRSAEGARLGDYDYPRPVIVQNSADEKSLIAYGRLREAIGNWEKAILRRQLALANLPEMLPTPVKPAPVDLAEEEQLSANVWSKLFPALLVIMAVTGAFYPAIDVGAGEKERGTMETLLICPARRTEIVLGKFLTVTLFSMSTALLNLVSMGMTGKYMASIAGGGSVRGIGDLALPSLSSLAWVFVFLIPLAALFSALSLALATFARSSKEGQYYLTPMLMVTLGLTVFCLSPAVEITPFYSILPVMGPALLLKGLLSPMGAASLYWYVLPVLAASVGYSLLALWWAIELFSREDVLFREAERFELRLWLRHLLRDKEALPSFAEAVFCFVGIMLLQFAAMRFMQEAFARAAPGTYDVLMLRLLLVQQLVIIASPALFMGVMLTTSIRRTFRLYLPGWRVLGIAAALPFVLHPLVVELFSSLSWFFPELPRNARAALQAMSDAEHPLWLVLLVFAAAPALCEELAYRGFILSGFSRSGRIGLGIVLSSVTFGLMHMFPQQVFSAGLLGLVLGLIAVRGGSLLPCFVFHFLFNSLEVLRGRADTAWFEQSVPAWFVRVEGESIRYGWGMLVPAGLLATALLYRLATLKGGEKRSRSVTAKVEGIENIADPRVPEKV